VSDLVDAVHKTITSFDANPLPKDDSRYSTSAFSDEKSHDYFFDQVFSFSFQTTTLSLFRVYYSVIMSLSERDEETTFIPPQPLVSDAENNRRYILHLSDNEDGEVDPIEKMYGPFEDALDTVPPYPKPYARLAKTAERIREEEILKLREAIRDMEQQRAQNMERKKLKEIEKEWKAVEGSRLRRTRISFAENRERLKALSEPIVIESDTDDAMEVEAVTDSVAVAESSEIQEMRLKTLIPKCK